jgi:ankyrin repeat protein
MSPLDQALKIGNLEVVKLLKEAGAKTGEKLCKNE